MPLDIMMPFYGRFDQFKSAVESVLAQTSGNWQLTIVDDCYPDPAPGEWAAAIRDNRVTYLRNEENLGVSGNFRRCADLMTEEFGVLMGCDDIMLPGYVARICALVDEFPDAAIVQPGVRVVDQDGRLVRPLADRVKAVYRFSGSGARTYSGEALAASLLRADWAYFPSLVWRASMIREIGFRLDLKVVQDLAMLVQIAKRGGVLVLDDEVVFEYRRHAQSVSSMTGPDGSKFIEERRVYIDSARDLDEIGWHRAARVARRHLVSRLSALSALPGALRSSDRIGCRTIISHVLGTRYTTDA